jgi:hypothetical protein
MEPLEPDPYLANPRERGRVAFLLRNGFQQAPVEVRDIPIQEVAQRRPPSAGIVFDVRHAGLDGIEAAAKTERFLPAEVQALNGIIQKLQHIGEPAPLLRPEGRPISELETPFFERQKAHREIAAVNGGDVAGRERLERPGVVPVEQVPAVPFEASERVEAVRQPRRQVVLPDITEITGSERRQEHHADVGRRCPVRDVTAGMFLKVVRREPLILGPDEHLEVSPGAAGDPSGAARGRPQSADVLAAAADGPVRRRPLARMNHMTRSGSATGSAWTRSVTTATSTTTARMGAIHICRQMKRLVFRRRALRTYGRRTSTGADDAV